MAFAVQVLRKMTPLSGCRELNETLKMQIEEMLSDSGDWKEIRFKELLDEISASGFSTMPRGTGALVKDDTLKIYYIGREITLGWSGFNVPLDIMDRLLILMYLRQAGSGALSGMWTAFRDFKDGLIRSESFHEACEIPLAKMFEHNEDLVLKSLTEAGAEKVKGFSTDYSYVINALPNLPMLVLMWPADEEFGADCKVLLDSSATEFLDIEALLYLGMALVRHVRGRG